MLMVFSFAPYFDFYMSYKDRLGNVDENADLQWIYRVAYKKYSKIAETKMEATRILGEEEVGESSSEGTILHCGSTWTMI